jgi:hypothetical protein
MKVDFYMAEAAAHEAAQHLENERDANKLKAARTPFVWLSASDIDSAINDEVLVAGDDDIWELRSIDSKVTDQQVDVNLAAVDYGVVKGDQAASLKLSETKVYFFKLFGKANREGRKKIIEIGYKKRY